MANAAPAAKTTTYLMVCDPRRSTGIIACGDGDGGAAPISCKKRKGSPPPHHPDPGYHFPIYPSIQVTLAPPRKKHPAGCYMC